MDLPRVARRIAEEVAAPTDMKTWVGIQHDGKGGIITVTGNISAPDAKEAEAVIKDMMRRSGTGGRLVIFDQASLPSYGLEFKGP